MPRLMNVGLHCRVIGRPGRARGRARFLDHIADVPGVCVMTRAEIAATGRRPIRPAAVPSERQRVSSGCTKSLT